MNIALISPDASSIKHRVRGTGSYFENLKKSLPIYDNKNTYTFPSRDQNLKGIDLVHYPFFEPFSLNLPLIKNKKIVVTVHDLTPLVFPKYFPSGIRGSLKWNVQKRLLKNIDAVITDSKKSKTDILKFVGMKEDKVHVVYLAAGENFKKLQNGNWKLGITKRYGLPERFVLYVGDVTWNKNLPGLIEAVKKIEAPLVMVGKALVDTDFDKKNLWNQDLLKVQQMTEGSKLITRLGFVPEEDLAALYNLATVFAMPSFYEGFGLPILEAMSSGTPVITSKEGSIPEVAGEAAYYVDAYNGDSIAKGIKKVFEDDTLRKELSEKGLKQANKFSWEKTVKETIRVYKNI